METLSEAKALALRAAGEKKYEEAVMHFQRITVDGIDLLNSFELTKYIFCLQRTGDFDKSLHLCRLALERFPGEPGIRQSCAWCLYFKYIRPNKNISGNDFTGAAREIVSLSSEEDRSSPLRPTLFKVLDRLNDRAAYPAQEVLEWLQYLEPSNLSDQVFSFNAGDGKTILLASEKERYYMHLTKSLFETAQYEACIKAVQTALELPIAWHYDNAVWFRRRRALSLRMTGQIKDALHLYDEILVSKKDWFLYAELAELHHLNKDVRAALTNACIAAQDKRNVAMQSRLFGLIASLFYETGDLNACELHVGLVFKLVETGKCRMNPRTALMAQTLGLTPDTGRLDLDKIWQDSLAVRRSYLDGQQEVITGKIIRLLPGNHSGFVADETGNKYYFNALEFKGSAREMIPDTKVRFNLKPGFDKKKGMACKNAVNISPL